MFFLSRLWLLHYYIFTVCTFDSLLTHCGLVMPYDNNISVYVKSCSGTDMTTSSNGNIFRVTGHLCGEFTDPGEFPAQRPVTRGFDVFFDLCLNERLSKQSWGWWFETLPCPLWRHCNDLAVKQQETWPQVVDALRMSGHVPGLFSVLPSGVVLEVLTYLCFMLVYGFKLCNCWSK